MVQFVCIMISCVRPFHTRVVCNSILWYSFHSFSICLRFQRHYRVFMINLVAAGFCWPILSIVSTQMGSKKKMSTSDSGMQMEIRRLYEFSCAFTLNLICGLISASRILFLVWKFSSDLSCGKQNSGIVIRILMCEMKHEKDAGMGQKIIDR